MDARKFALFGGSVMLAMGLLALIPSFVGSSYGLPLLTLDTSYGLFLGYFPMNIVNKSALIGFGVAGLIIASSDVNSVSRSISYSRAVFIVMGLGAVLGLIPQTATFFGYWPLFGAEILVHAIFALLGAYFGYAAGSRVHREMYT